MSSRTSSLTYILNTFLMTNSRTQKFIVCYTYGTCIRIAFQNQNDFPLNTRVYRALGLICSTYRAYTCLCGYQSTIGCPPLSLPHKTRTAFAVCSSGRTLGTKHLSFSNYIRFLLAFHLRLLCVQQFESILSSERV